MPSKWNRFSEWLGEMLPRKGIAHTELPEIVGGGHRQFFAQISSVPILQKREHRLKLLAEKLMEPLSKLRFLSGINPWTHLPLDDQLALWEAIERIVLVGNNPDLPTLRERLDKAVKAGIAPSMLPEGLLERLSENGNANAEDVGTGE